MPGLSLSAILEIILGVLKFPGAVLQVIRVLQKTPEEKHDELLKQMSDEALKFQEIGRPTWQN